jgi:hypothetical protein
MRAHTITTTRETPKARRSAAAIILAASALIIPTAANAQSDYSTPNAITGASQTSSQPRGSSDYSSINAITSPSSQFNSASGSPGANSGYSSLNAITGPPPSEPTAVSDFPSSSGDGFDWGDAALGAAAALALLTLGGALFLRLRRRTAVSPTTAALS